MATRIQMRIVEEALRYTDAVHDVLDNAAYTLKAIEPDSGDPLLIEGVAATVDGIKAIIVNRANTARAIKSQLQQYIDVLGVPTIAAALNAVGVTASVVQADLNNFFTVATYIKDNIGAATTLTDLETLGDYILSNIPERLPLLRRRWVL